MAPQTLVLLPGLLNTRRLYESQIADLADIADAIVPELWHHNSIGAMAQAPSMRRRSALRSVASRWAAMSASRSCAARPTGSSDWR